MNLNRLILGLFFILLVSCKQEPLKVTFPENIDNLDSIWSHEYTVIIYIKPEGCISCIFNDLNPWKLYQNVLSKYDINVLLIINSMGENNVVKMLKHLNIKFPAILDKKSRFRIMNDKIFQAVPDNIFVIDKDKNVIFSGSPIVTEEKWKSFVKLLDVKSQ
jgi:hypothetical protein